MRNIRLVRVLCLVLFLGSNSLAYAVNEGWDAGFNMGSAEVENINESDLGYKLYGGYLTRYFGAEMSFAGLGDGYTPEQVDIYGMSLEFVGRLPVNDNFSLLAKFGIFWWTVDNCYFGYYYYDCTGGYYDDGSDLTYGVGMQYDMTKNVSLRAEYQEYSDVSGSDVSLINAGVLYTFW